MLLTPRTPPLSLLQYRSLLARISTKHTQYERISQDASQFESGYYGEKSMDYFYEFVPDSIDIFHQLKLQSVSGTYRYQIDTLLLSPSFFAILEIKNYAGTVYFDPHYAQIIRNVNQEEIVFPCPLQQVFRQKLQLEALLKRLHLPAVPMITHVFNTNQRSKISSASPILNLSHASKLPTLLQDWQSTFTETSLTPAQYKKLLQYLARNNLPDRKYLLDQYQLEKKDISKGVACEECGTLPMSRSRGLWKCIGCGYTSKIAHIRALQDYQNIFSTTITMQEAMHWLLLRSTATTKKVIADAVQNKGAEKYKRTYSIK